MIFCAFALLLAATAACVVAAVEVDVELTAEVAMVNQIKIRGVSSTESVSSKKNEGVSSNS
jgi:predicted porin